MSDDTIRARGPYRSKLVREPKAARALTLQERDLAILRAVFDNRFLSRSLIGHLFPPKPSPIPGTASTGRATGSNLDRRLSGLFHTGYVDRISGASSGEFVYQLTRKGARVLSARQPELPFSQGTDWSKRTQGPAGFFLEHALMVARLRVALTVALRELPSLELETFQRECDDLNHDWQVGRQRLLVRPDAFFTLRDPGQQAGRNQRHCFVEADRGTMTLARLRAKFECYAALHEGGQLQEVYGMRSCRVLTITTSEKRCSNLVALVRESERHPLPQLRDRFLFTTEARYASALSNVLAPIWQSADRPAQRRALVPTALPER